MKERRQEERGKRRKERVERRTERGEREQWPQQETVWFRLANHSPGCIRRREVLVSPRGPLFLASRITMVGNSGVPKTFCQTPDGGSLAADIRDQDREFRPSENGKQTPDPSPLADHPPLMGGPRHRSKPAVGMDISIAPPASALFRLGSTG